jgi:hypothetical protein
MFLFDNQSTYLKMTVSSDILRVCVTTYDFRQGGPNLFITIK